MSEGRRPLQFPALPPHHRAQGHWSQNIRKAHDIVSDTYNHATRVLRQEDHDPLRLQIIAEKIINDSLPVLEALDSEIQDASWTDKCAEALATTVVELRQASEAAVNIANSRYAKVNPVSTETAPYQTRGRPRKVIDSRWLEDALSPRRKITFKRLAVALHMHRNTLRRHLKRHNVYQRFSAICNADLDILVKTFKFHKPDSGLQLPSWLSMIP
ncbi:hypothetical protein DFH29DRAFT_27139 [Suillus ampliporus]|nr:hypothetical protein DFH29DRAFT_27139 [Suillus ampliporus]